MQLFIQANSIINWAGTTLARSSLPHLVRRLVQVTASQSDIIRIDFPAYESVQRPGFDGEVLCIVGNSWIPAGHSVWELSVEASPGSKATGDFNARSETPTEVKNQATYVALTARHWKNKKEWAAERKTGHGWKDVLAYDADDVEQWLESAPFGLKLWFARMLNIPSLGFDDVMERWNVLANIAQPNLLPDVFLAGRQENVLAIKSWLASEPFVLRASYRSPDEVIDFFCACVASMNSSEQESVCNRLAIIRSPDAWIYSRDSETRSILILDPSLGIQLDEALRAVRNGHHVLLADEASRDVGDSGIHLKRPSIFQVSEALVKSGYQRPRADQLARSAGGSSAILKRLILRSPASLPTWENTIPSRVISACLLLGGWSNSEVDKSAFAELSGVPYDDCEVNLKRMASAPDPILFFSAGNWRLISKDYAWSVLSNYVTDASLNAFEDLAVRILGENNPRFELSEDKRPYAAITGHLPRYSPTIKHHVAETLAFLGAFGTELDLTLRQMSPAIDRIVASLLGAGCNWERWASIGHDLPYLAEASPRSFVNAVVADLKHEDSQLRKVFDEEEHALLGRCNHAGLLWALETLAWSPRHLPFVVKTLVELASKDSKTGKWGNRPSASLQAILLSWYPQTSATIEERIKCLDLIIATDRNAAWKILISLLPDVNGTSSPTRFPHWQSWANEWREGATRGETAQFADATADRVIQQLGVDYDRWLDVFENVGKLPSTSFQKLVGAMDTLAALEIDEETRQKMSTKLSKQIARHTRFSNAHWALEAEEVDQLKSALERLKPRNPVNRHVGLFDNWPELFLEREKSHKENEADLHNARVEAVKEIIDQIGFDGILSLLEKVQAAGALGIAVADSMNDLYVSEVIPSFLESNDPSLNFVSGFVWSRFRREGWQWLNPQISSCASPSSKAKLLCIIRFSPEVWKRVEEEGVEVTTEYWRICRAFNPDLSAEDIEFAVGRLVATDRLVDSLDLLSMSLHQKQNISISTLFSPLEAFFNLEPAKFSAEYSRLDAHDVVQVIGELQKRKDVEIKRLLNVEWHFIKLLDGYHGNSPRGLHKHLSESPEFFNEVLSYCYRSRLEQEGENDEPDELRKVYAKNAFYLLHDWAAMPGLDVDGSINEQRLLNWCQEARRIAKESGRLGVCDSNIGQVFAKCEVKDPDEKWPSLPVRNVMSEIMSEEMKSGFYCGMINKRGAFCRGEGGSDERSLAVEHRQCAASIRFEHPEVASILDELADYYERDARRWDEQDDWERE